MENRDNIRHVRGICNARKLSIASVANSDTQEITVTEGFGEVELRLATSSYPAGLTPSQARVLATQLIAAADAVESRGE